MAEYIYISIFKANVQSRTEQKDMVANDKGYKSQNLVPQR